VFAHRILPSEWICSKRWFVRAMVCKGDGFHITIGIEYLS
jgi:hypothetical protein